MRGLTDRRFPSPLRYPGGKGKIANFVKLLFTENAMSDFAYAEPYAGGASVALSLLFEEYASRIYINDLNRSVFAFWNAVLDDTDRLCARISSTSVTMAEWRRQRTIQRDANAEGLDLAFSTFFLNRTNRSGIIDGGVIGGRGQAGTWRLDARYNKLELIRRIQKIAGYRNRITLTNLDAAELIQGLYQTISTRTLIYLDPPYYVKGSGLYESFYRPDDHRLIAEIVPSLKMPWIVSYDAAPPVMKLYHRYRKITYGLSYSAQDRYKGAEVMFFSHGLRIPPVISPANLFLGDVHKRRVGTLPGDQLEARRG
jgi:DNA adenine methylase